MEKNTARKALENMNPDPEKESPRRSWMYIFIGIILIFGLTFIFQQLNDSPNETIDPYSFDQLKDQVQNMRQQLDQLENQNSALEERIEDLESLIE
ncbi:MAG TPA: hypothetical protein H9946_08055 [Candidatus Jeotgalibaca pullicola]|nr:hypothetical protein [Candidatus Jeotgalibaca pullicola]